MKEWVREKLIGEGFAVNKNEFRVLDSDGCHAIKQAIFSA
jgi:hypothetical protein